MKRSSSSVGKRGTSGFFCVGVMPLHAIWSVTQTGFGPATFMSFVVMSPTTLRSWLAVSACVPGGYETG